MQMAHFGGLGNREECAHIASNVNWAFLQAALEQFEVIAEDMKH